MDKIKSNILHILQELKGSGKFASVNTTDFVLPGLIVENVGELAFPVTESQAKNLIKEATQAPYGHGSQTIVDKNVRNTWEIDGDKLRFTNPAWPRLLDKVVNTVKKDLGIKEYEVRAELYKLLIYEEGGYFLRHKDSEKKKGMFGTLILNLPSTYTGGELVVEFEKEEIVADFAGKSAFDLGFTAFYADCDHEVKPVLSGYRICLTYNLIQEKADQKIELTSIQDASDRLALAFKQYGKIHQDKPILVLLGHQYTPESFSDYNLKLNDRLKAEVLLTAAQKLGAYGKLCLITSFITGTPSYDGYEYDEDINIDIMEDIIDSSLSIEHWDSSEIPELSEVPFEEDDFITSFAFEDHEPILKESTGYMGNYGPDLEHWYHFGAVMIWTHETNASLLSSQTVDTQLDWIEFFSRSKETSKLEKEAIKSVIISGQLMGRYHESPGRHYVIIDWLLSFKQVDLLFSISDDLLSFYFVKIPSYYWLKLFKELSKDKIKLFLNKNLTNVTIPVLERCISVLADMSNDPPFQYIALEYFVKLPTYFNNLYDSQEKRVQMETIDQLIEIDKNLSPPSHAIYELAQSIFTNPKRKNIHKAISSALLNTKYRGVLSDLLLEMTKEFLQKRVEDQPQPPTTWSRVVPSGERYKRQWAILKNFLESPTDQVFNYSIRKQEREEMENAIRNTTIDLDMVTINRGSPHTLRITKNQAHYNRQLIKWHEDVELLEKLSNL